jgi:ParB family chromosome partitioning protein
MARRRRLGPIGPQEDSPGTEGTEGTERQAAARSLRGPAVPIAQTAGEAASAAAGEIARLRAEAEDGREAAQALDAARAEGRVLADIALDLVEARYMPRDRMPSVDEDEALLALKASLRETGQRVPVELVALADGRYGLIAGWRRLQALQTLHWETREARFATVRALVRPEGDRAQAFRAMVEENEIRADLSHYERGRICVLAAEDGAFADPDAALAILFSAGSAARRSKIRSFMTVHEALGDLLAWPEHLPERLGLELARALKWGREDALRRVLAGQATRWRGPADEQAALKAVLAGQGVPELDTPAGGVTPSGLAAGGTGRGSGRTGSRRSPDPARHRVVDLAPGLRLEQRSFDGHTDLRLSGEGLDEAAVAAAIEAVRAALRS